MYHYDITREKATATVDPRAVIAARAEIKRLRRRAATLADYDRVAEVRTADRIARLLRLDLLEGERP